MRQGARWLVVMPLAVVGSVAVGMTSTSAVRVPTVTAGVTLVNCAAAGGCIADIVDGSGMPIPSQDYIDAAFQYYLDNNFGDYTPNAVFTPVNLAGVLELETIAGAATSLVGDLTILF